MRFTEFGSRDNPTLVCIPGLLGGAEDFSYMLVSWQQVFHILVADPNDQYRGNGVAGLTVQTMEKISYDTATDEIAGALEAIGKEKAYAIGVSLGGKVVYDFAIRFPESFAGGVVLDVGPAAFEETCLFRFIDDLVQNFDLSHPWPELKRRLAERISDRHLRIMIQTQLSYPDLKPPAVWKPPMKNFGAMLSRQEINDQLSDLESVDEKLAQQNSLIHIFRAELLSGISEVSLAQLRDLESVRIHPVPGATHFLHVSHKDVVADFVLRLPELSPFYVGQTMFARPVAHSDFFQG